MPDLYQPKPGEMAVIQAETPVRILAVDPLSRLATVQLPGRGPTIDLPWVSLAPWRETPVASDPALARIEQLLEQLLARTGGAP